MLLIVHKTWQAAGKFPPISKAVDLPARGRREHCAVTASLSKSTLFSQNVVPLLFPRRNSITSVFVASLPRLRSDAMGKGILLWLLGIPIPVIILLYVFHVI
jgi:hypothetical protein